MCVTWTESWTFNAFTGLLTDAIAFDIQAQDETSWSFPDINRLAKASFINAAFSIESAANACIARMTYPEMVIQQIDKSQVIDKFDILYQVAIGKKLNKGCKPMQCAGEIVGLRNRYVHPKLDKAEVVINQTDEKGRTYDRPESQTKETQFLKIPKSFDLWTGRHSRIVVKETLSFLNHFFVDLCGLDREKCSNLLAIFTKGPDHTATYLSKHQREILEKCKQEYSIEIGFLVY